MLRVWRSSSPPFPYPIAWPCAWAFSLRRSSSREGNPQGDHSRNCRRSTTLDSWPRTDSWSGWWYHFSMPLKHSTIAIMSLGRKSSACTHYVSRRRTLSPESCLVESSTPERNILGSVDLPVGTMTCLGCYLLSWSHGAGPGRMSALSFAFRMN